MKTLLASTMLALVTGFVATTAQAAVTELSFSDPSLESGTANEVGSVYRYTNITGDSTVDLLLTITNKSAGAQITGVGGNAQYFNSGADNLTVTIDRVANEIDTYVLLNFQFVEAGTTNLTSVDDSVLTFADIDSYDGDALLFSDYVEFAAIDFDSIISVGSDLSVVGIGPSPLLAGDRYVGPLDREEEVLGNDPGQIDVSVIVSSHGVQAFDLVWGFTSATGGVRPGERGMLLDGSYELQTVTVVPEPASAAMLGLAGLAVVAGVSRRRK